MSDDPKTVPTTYTGRCEHCPSHTPLRPFPEDIQRAKEDVASLGLDEGIAHAVAVLVAGGVESCEGGPGHSFPEPTIRFEGQTSEGLRALSVALENGLPVSDLRRVWSMIEGVIHGPWWEMTFHPQRPPGPQLWWKALPRAEP